MVFQRQHIISESERNRILNLYNRPSIAESILIKDWLSPDEKYCIFLDELYDIENKTKIGNIWENFDHFKFFLKHSFEVAKDVSQEIKESVTELLNSMVITESNKNMVGLKPLVAEFILEQEKKGFLGNTLDWVKQTGSDALASVKQFGSKSIEGLKNLYTNIKDGDWSKAFQLIGKGILYVARTIRKALYNPIGILLDAILVATGIGKSAQFVIWAVVVGLDLYELTTGNYEDPNLSIEWRLLFLGIDILGLVFAGAAAKAAKGPIGALIRKFGSTSQGFSNAVKSSTILQGTVQKILSATKSAGGIISKATSFLQKSAPKIFNFISKPISALGGFISKIVQVFSGVLKGGFKAVSAPGKAVKSVLGGGKVGSAAQAAINVGVPLAALGGYQKGKEGEQYLELAQAFQANKANYDNIEW